MVLDVWALAVPAAQSKSPVRTAYFLMVLVVIILMVPGSVVERRKLRCCSILDKNILVTLPQILAYTPGACYRMFVRIEPQRHFDDFSAQEQDRRPARILINNAVIVLCPKSSLLFPQTNKQAAAE